MLIGSITVGVRSMNFKEGEVLYFDKPLKWTSFAVVNKIRYHICRKLGVKKLKVGHAGTLDPLATGVMIICTGKATKRIEEFQYHTKEYVATLQLGATTPSYDLEKEIDATYPTEHITRELVEETLKRFIGSIEQIPPAFSACMVNGKRAYDLARKGEEVELKPKLLVIDEISMVRADLLDAVDDILRRYRSKNEPFGGVQLLLIGDLQQLAPVVKEDEWALLKQHYASAFFFHSKALAATRYVMIELKHVYRQQDREFVDLLNRVRENRVDTAVLGMLNRRYIPDFKPSDEEGYITLTTHNHQAQRINDVKMAELSTRAYSFKAEVKDNFPTYSYPTEETLVLKQGAQVMFVKNDSSPEKRYYNGKIGKIIRSEWKFRRS